MGKAQFGMIGLGVMGRNFLLNVAERGGVCVGYDLDAEKRNLLDAEVAGMSVSAAHDLPEFIAALERPRRIMLLVPAGKAVDAVLGNLLSHLEPGDVVIDGGNSHFPDTERRETELAAKGIEFLGVGVSGGEEGARRGPSIMIGGRAESYEKVRAILEAVSAKVSGEPCAARVGSGSAGHFVKMVHNGIEYGLMQLIAETYDLMRRGLGMNSVEMADVFAEWNGGELSSFLVEITATVLRKIDDETGRPLVEMLLDTAGQKGTGKWTSQAALDMGVPVPTIDSAVTMRQLSAMKQERISASERQTKISSELINNTKFTINNLRDALYFSFITTYAQGLMLLKTASDEKNYGIDLTQVAKIWRGGCIIRAALLEVIRTALAANPALPNLMQDEKFTGLLAENIDSMRAVAAASVTEGFPSYCLTSSLAYYDAYHRARLPANLIQAQRDFFGAHTFQRIDKEGTFHTSDWSK